MSYFDYTVQHEMSASAEVKESAPSPTLHSAAQDLQEAWLELVGAFVVSPLIGCIQAVTRALRWWADFYGGRKCS